MCDNKKEEFKAKFDAVAAEIGKTGKKVAKKTVRMADAAAVRIKLSTASAKLATEYETLGKLSYNKLVKDRDNTEKIAASIDKIDELIIEVDALKAELAAKMKAINETE